MAHYVAQLIERAATATGDQRAKAEKTAAEAILELWRNHTTMPNGRRPFEELEPVVEVLRSLDTSTPHFYRSDVFIGGAANEVQEAVRDWLAVVQGIDYSARVLIEYALSRAVEAAGPAPRDWMKLVRDPSMLSSNKFMLIEELLGSGDQPSGARTTAKELEDRRNANQDRLNRLNGLVGFAVRLSEELQTMIAAIDAELASTTE